MKEREIRKLIKILEETEIEELEIRKWWGGRLRIAKRIRGGLQVPSTAGVAEAPEPSVPEPPAAEEVEFSDQTHYIVHSPIVGTFYRAPAPDAPPYVEVGDTIKAGQVVCIVEAMKLMNEIQAERGGRVAKILVDNAQPVEYNQMMMVLEPEA